MGPTRTPRRLAVLAALLSLVLVAAACGSSSSSSSSSTSAGSQKGSLTIGSKDFTGALILGQVYGQALEAAGWSVKFKENLGATEVAYPALQHGDLDLYPDYQGTVLAYLKGQGTGDRQETYQRLQQKLAGTDIVASTPAPAVDVNGYYMLKSKADQLGVKTLSDLEPYAPQLVFGGPPECPTRPLCLPGLEQTYGLHFKEVKKLDTGGPVTAKDLTDGVIDVGTLFTGSSVIPSGVVLLQDDKHLQPADNPVVLVRKSKSTPELQQTLDKVSAQLTTAAYNEMNAGVTRDKKDPKDVAKTFLSAHGLD